MRASGQLERPDHDARGVRRVRRGGARPHGARRAARGDRKAFNGVPVLRGLDLEILRGSTVTVMGGSGSGKTVLLRLTAGLIKPDRGRVRTLGVDITPLREEALLPVRRHMGFVFQGAALFDSLTVYENVAYPLREHASLPEPEVAERVHRLLGAGGAPRRRRQAARRAVGGDAQARGDRPGARARPGAGALRRADGRARPDERPAHHRARGEPQGGGRVRDRHGRDARPRVRAERVGSDRRPDRRPDRRDRARRGAAPVGAAEVQAFLAGEAR